MDTTVQRKYAMTRVRSGDYLFPSNAATLLWRVYRYEEDGSLEDGNGGFVKGTYWAVAYFDGTMEQAEGLLNRDPDEFLSWSCWYGWEVLLKTRAEAIESALRKDAAVMREP